MGVRAVFMALGIIVAQRPLPTAVATASTIFLNSNSLSSALGGPAGGLGVAAIGLPAVLLIPAALILVAATGLAVMDRAIDGGREPLPTPARAQERTDQRTFHEMPGMTSTVADL